MITCSSKHASRGLSWVVILAVCALWTLPAHAGMRCGSRLVTGGDHKLEVLNKCGHPTLVERHAGHRHVFAPRVFGHERRPILLEGEIEEWTYNFGPRRFMRLVRFADGKVVRIISLGYGY